VHDFHNEVLAHQYLQSEVVLYHHEHLVLFYDEMIKILDSTGNQAKCVRDIITEKNIPYTNPYRKKVVTYGRTACSG
jgi:hypothetical protein